MVGRQSSPVREAVQPGLPSALAARILADCWGALLRAVGQSQEYIQHTHLVHRLALGGLDGRALRRQLAEMQVGRQARQGIGHRGVVALLIVPARV